jgi:hypothetical protein
MLEKNSLDCLPANSDLRNDVSFSTSLLTQPDDFGLQIWRERLCFH